MNVGGMRKGAEFELMQQLRSDVITWETLGGQPPDHYLFRYDLTSIAGMNECGTPVMERRIWEVEVKLKGNHPWGKPDAFFRGPSILHPNVWVGGSICIEDTFKAGVGIPLDKLCEHIGKIIAYQRYNMQSPANKNQRLFDWITETAAALLPTDRRDILRPRIAIGNNADADQTPKPPANTRIAFG